jgi:hypothetical protein
MEDFAGCTHYSAPVEDAPPEPLQMVVPIMPDIPKVTVGGVARSIAFE